MKLGFATSAFQVEGGLSSDGRGPSIWDAACPEAEQACQSWSSFERDRELLAWCGAQVYRFSVSWPRLSPDGVSFRANQLAPYDRLVDHLLALDIEPYITLYHWDLPTALEGGWKNPETGLRFRDYVAQVVAPLRDRVKHWFTLNEPWCSAELGYGTGQHAPFETGAAERVRINLLEAHRLGGEVIQNLGVEAGIAMVPLPFLPLTPDDTSAAERAWQEVNDPWFKPLAPVDFLGLNLYYPTYVQATEKGYRDVTDQVLAPRSSQGWPVVTDFLKPTLERMKQRYGMGRFVVSEIGCPTDDDQLRLTFLRNALPQLTQAEAVFLWTLRDNLEWQFGFGQKYGLFERDGRPKPSATWFRQTLANARW